MSRNTKRTSRGGASKSPATTLTGTSHSKAGPSRPPSQIGHRPRHLRGSCNLSSLVRIFSSPRINSRSTARAPLLCCVFSGPPKRQPLPPQSARFREMTGRKQGRGPLPPSASAGHHNDIAPQQPNVDGPSRGQGGPNYAPSGPRSHPPAQEAVADRPLRPAGGSTRTRTRFGDAPTNDSPFADAARNQPASRSKIDIDRPSRSQAPVDDDAPYRQSGAVRNDRVDRVAESSMGAVPTGPRAMARGPSNYSQQQQQQQPPSSQGYSSRGPHTPVSPVAGNVPLPQRSGRERMDRMDQPPPSVRPNSQQVPHGPRSFENGRAPQNNDTPSDRMYDQYPPVRSACYYLSFSSDSPLHGKPPTQSRLTVPRGNPYVPQRMLNPGEVPKNARPSNAEWREAAPHLDASASGQILYETERRVGPQLCAVSVTSD